MPKKPEKLEKKEIIESCFQYAFEGRLEDIILSFQNIPISHKSGEYHRFAIEDVSMWDTFDFHLVGFRWETDAEYDERMLIAKSLKESKAREKTKKEGLERAEYERLKNKFKGK